MKLVSAALGNKRKPVTTANGPRYQVRWYIDLGAGRIKERKKTSFFSVGEANQFIEQLHKANYRADGWHFTPDGTPSNDCVSPTTVLDALEQYVKTKWDVAWSDNQRTKVRGRLLTLAATTLVQPRDRELLLAAFMEQRTDRGARPDPRTPVEWAGRWLRDEGLHPRKVEPRDPDMAKGREWVKTRSMPVSSLDDGVVTDVMHRFTVGYADSTARTYWSDIVVPFLTWLQVTRKVDHNLVAGLPEITRDLEAERPDPRRILNPRQIEEIAGAMASAHGEEWGLFIKLATYCALRISEAFAIQTSSFYRRPDGRLVLEVTEQEHRVVAASNDEGKTKVRTKTKSTRHRTPKPRRIPVPAELEARLVAHLGAELGVGNRHLFVGPRGAVGNYQTVSGWWTQIVNEKFPGGHRLTGIKPHSMRHAGMTWWFASRYDEALIQKWGGWQSLKVMLDTYRGVLEDTDSVSLDGMDRFEAAGIGTIHDEAEDVDGSVQRPLEADASEVAGNVIDFQAWRARRLA